MEEAFEYTGGIPTPQAVVDAGGEQWAVLADTILRRIDEMAVGEILEIVSQERRNRADIPAWCYLSGHDLMQMWTSGKSTRFWIRKGDTGRKRRTEGGRAVS